MSHKETSKEILGLSRITKKRILDLCKKDKLYQTPELNDVLYLHYQGFDCIECLDDYTELKCLWLECNAISEIQGLNKLTKLKCLFLQSNLIRKIENLGNCKELDTLNLSQNHIRKIENVGFEVLPVLNTLNLASNYLKDPESLKELENCKNLSVLDLSNNRIDDILVVKIFSQMAELKVLVLQGNPVVSKIPQYRKTLILECTKLTYLDSRPVFPKDRACAEAWKRGGYGEERKEHERWNRKERKKMRDSVNATIHLRNKHRGLEDQLSIIPSSDSEDDTKAKNRNIRIIDDPDAGEDCVWNEVAENKSSDDDNDEIGSETGRSGGKSSCKEKTNDCTLNYKENTEILTLQQIGHQNNTNEVIMHNSNAVKELDNLEDLKATIPSDSAEVHKESYESTIEVIKQMTKESGTGYELSKEVNEAMDIFSQEVNNDEAACQFETKVELKKSLRELESEKEGLRVNKQFENDFGELCTSMTSFVSQLEKEQTEREEIKDPLFCDDKSVKESSCESSDSEGENNVQKSKIDRLIDRWDNESKLQTKSAEILQGISKNEQGKVNLSEIQENEGKKWLNNGEQKEHEEREEIKRDIFCNEKIATENSCEAYNYKGDDSIQKSKMNCSESTEMFMENVQGKTNLPIIAGNEILKDKLLNDPGELEESSIADICVENKVGQESINSEEMDCEDTYVPMDISLLTRKSNEALLSLERESFELKILLQKLENNNEELFKGINSKDKKIDQTRNKNVQEASQNTKRNNSDYNSSQRKEEINGKVVVEIVEEILQSFHSVHLKQKSYEFPFDLKEENEDLSSINSIKKLTETEETSDSIPQVIESFNTFFDKIEVMQGSVRTPSLENFDQQKSIITKELSLKSNLKQFNNDTLQSLDVQLEEMRRNQHEKVRRMVDRVYAQKDRYNDTLELVDGKLMVRNQLTKQLQDTSKPLQYDPSDAEDGYDTALSEDDEPNRKERQRKQAFKLFKPTVRKSDEELVIKTLNENKQIDFSDESDESNDEFFSLDGQEKPYLYNIDKELIKNLNFDFANLTHQDENHIVQCARSYEELKHCLALNKEERCLIKEENELLENIAKIKPVTDTKNPIVATGLSKEEQIWFNKNTLNIHNPAKKLEKPAENYLSGVATILCDKNKQESFPTVEQQSEEEKNEIESNIDFANGASNSKIFDYMESLEFSKDVFENVGETEKVLPEIITHESLPENSANNYADLEILECNLEIISAEDEVIDTITVNAELHI